MQIGAEEYNSTGHFERLADLVSWTVADEAVECVVQRLMDLRRDHVLVDSHYTEVPTYLNDYFKGKNLAKVAMHIERAKTAKPRMEVLLRRELHILSGR